MQKAIKKEVVMLKIRPTIVGGMVDVKVSVVSKEVDYTKEEISMLDFYYQHTECDCIDITTFGGYENGYSVVVDDEGLLKSGNVVIEYTLPIEGEKVELQLSGTILIGKSGYVENKEHDGMYEIGLTNEDLDYIQDNLEIKLLGITR